MDKGQCTALVHPLSQIHSLSVSHSLSACLSFSLFFCSVSEERVQGGTCLTSLKWHQSKPNVPESRGQGAALGCHGSKSLVRCMLRGHKVTQSRFELVQHELMCASKYPSVSPCLSPAEEHVCPFMFTSWSQLK